ncbi:MAG: DUF2523 domain-containing protein [Undibacterium sp.]|uniref:DUF2523 domain-containing protein n=1 Tax=Undibacterium sp. TaxID=1914977 RepID=UPI002725CA4D|nr:DUF2523 domain-containing protein [Undibacterium sp.]MDO8652073.1 DUF2523 domain-containing protein [Undibacterium sp.]
MKIGTWLLAMLTPMIGRILAALGFSVVTVLGMEGILSQVRTSLVSGLGGMSGDMFNVFLLAGGGQALGIITGALTTRLLLWQVQNATRILGVNPS